MTAPGRGSVTTKITSRRPRTEHLAIWPEEADLLLVEDGITTTARAGTKDLPFGVITGRWPVPCPAIPNERLKPERSRTRARVWVTIVDLLGPIAERRQGRQITAPISASAVRTRR
jgi:hypothetical protein